MPITPKQRVTLLLAMMQDYSEDVRFISRLELERMAELADRCIAIEQERRNVEMANEAIADFEYEMSAA
jgi:hypothetical protein